MSENNDQTQDITLFDELGNPVAVVQDGLIFRLAVDVNKDGGVALQKFSPVVDFETATPVVINASTDTSIFLESGHPGKIDFVGIQGTTNSNYEVVLKVDGVEIFRIPASDLGSILDLTGNTGLPLPLWTEIANKNFRYHPNQGVDFNNSFEVLVKSTQVPLTTITWLVTHRELI